MTISELAGYSGIAEKTVRRKIDFIVGVVKDSETGTLIIPNGTRYPYDIHRYKFDNIEKRRMALLDATYHYRYVDSKMLQMPQESFEEMITELVQAHLLRLNNIENEYGANKYDTTMVYEEIRQLSRAKRVKEITKIIASSSGHFIGGMINELI